MLTERLILDLNEPAWTPPEGTIVLAWDHLPDLADLHPWEYLVEVTYGPVAEVLAAVSDEAPLTHRLELAA